MTTSDNNQINCATTVERQFTASPNLAIPDANPIGVSTNIAISDQPGRVSALEV